MHPIPSLVSLALYTFSWYAKALCKIHNSKLSASDADSSAAPNSVTAIIAEKISIIPAVCCNDGDSLSIITPQTMVSTGCNNTAKDVWAAGSLGRA